MERIILMLKNAGLMGRKNVGILIFDRLGLQLKKKTKVNPNCSVARCRAKAPHLSDPVVAGLVQNFSDLAKVAHWTCACRAELDV